MVLDGLLQPPSRHVGWCAALAVINGKPSAKRGCNWGMKVSHLAEVLTCRQSVLGLGPMEVNRPEGWGHQYPKYKTGFARKF